MPDDELDHYRPQVAAVTADDVLPPRTHVRPDEAAIVLVGDAATFEADLRKADLGEISVLREADAAETD